MNTIKNTFKSNHLIFLLLVVLFIVKSSLVLVYFNFEVTDNDQAQFWLACHDFSNFNFYTPFIYGCTYGNMLESALAIPFYMMGMPLYYALPFSNFFWFTSLIIAFSIGLNSRSKASHLGSIFLFFFALLDNSFFAVTYAAKGHMAGIFPALLGGIFLIYCQQRFLMLLLGVVFGLSIQMNPNALFLILFLLLFIQSRKQVLPLIIGGLMSLSFHIINSRYLALTDTGFLHTQWQIEFHYSDFLKTIDHLDTYLNSITPFFTRMGFLSLLFPLLLSLVFLYKKQQLKGLLMISYLFTIVFSFGVNKIVDGSNDLLFPFFRFYLALALCNALCMAYLVKLTEISHKSKYVFLSLPLIVLFSVFNGLTGLKEMSGKAGNTYSVKKSSIKDLKENCKSILATAYTYQSKNILLVTGDYPLYAEMIYLKTLEPKDIEIVFHHNMFYWMQNQKHQKNKKDVLVFITFEGLLKSDKIKSIQKNQINSKIPAYLFRDVNRPYERIESLIN